MNFTSIFTLPVNPDRRWDVWGNDVYCVYQVVFRLGKFQHWQLIPFWPELHFWCVKNVRADLWENHGVYFIRTLLEYWCFILLVSWYLEAWWVGKSEEVSSVHQIFCHFFPLCGVALGLSSARILQRCNWLLLLDAISGISSQCAVLRQSFGDSCIWSLIMPSNSILPQPHIKQSQ